MQEANIYFTVRIIDCFAFFLLHLLGWAAEKMRKEGMGKMVNMVSPGLGSSFFWFCTWRVPREG